MPAPAPEDFEGAAGCAFAAVIGTTFEDAGLAVEVAACDSGPTEEGGAAETGALDSGAAETGPESEAGGADIGAPPIDEGGADARLEGIGVAIDDGTGSGVESGAPPEPELTDGGGGVFETRSASSLSEGRF